MIVPNKYKAINATFVLMNVNFVYRRWFMNGEKLFSRLIFLKTIFVYPLKSYFRLLLKKFLTSSAHSFSCIPPVIVVLGCVIF
jgi:hypothetical protein